MSIKKNPPTDMVAWIMSTNEIGSPKPAQKSKPLPMPRRQAVSSSNLQSAGYREAEYKLYIRFRNSSSLYVYSAVPPRLWADFQRADSKGEFFHRRIDGVFDYEIKEPK
jgi:hypothetical protein